MFAKLFFLFALLPIAEIMVLINVSDSIGGWNTFFLVVLSAFIGAYFVRREGVATLQKVQAKMASGDMPSAEISEGLLLLLAGVLLVTPGFITDGVGLLFTLPFTRKKIAAKVIQWLPISKMGAGASANFYHQSSSTSYNESQEGNVIDGEYDDKTESNSQDDKSNKRLN